MAEKTDEYNGCLKGSIEQARDYARESFVYGLKTKDELTEEFHVSARTVEKSTQNMGDWFQECLQTRVIKESRKHVKYISLDCRNYSVNPLYKMWKACSFTTNEIVFFFFILDYLTKKEEPVSLAELHEAYYFMHRSDGFQKSSAKKWLENKGLPSGIIVKAGRGKYSLAPSVALSEMRDLLQYYSEIAPGGVIGSFITDKLDACKSPFGFKQHYIGQAFDCEIICSILLAIKNNCSVSLYYLTRSKWEIEANVLPVKVLSSTQNGRQYLIAWDENSKRFFNYRLDRIKTITILDSSSADVGKRHEQYRQIEKHMWGVSLGDGEKVHVEFCVKVKEDEAYIINRLYREMRCGTVEPVPDSPGLVKFSADVYDAHEMFPWIRTFICRIVSLKISDHELEKHFWKAISDMYDIYF